MENMIWWTCS